MCRQLSSEQSHVNGSKIFLRDLVPQQPLCLEIMSSPSAMSTRFYIAATFTKCHLTQTQIKSCVMSTMPLQVCLCGCATADDVENIASSIMFFYLFVYLFLSAKTRFNFQPCTHTLRLLLHSNMRHQEMALFFASHSGI